METLRTVSALCKGKHAKIERKLKSSLAMVKHLRERIVKQESLDRDEPVGSKQGSTQAEPVGVDDNTKTMQSARAEEESIHKNFLITEGKYMLGRLQQLLDLSTETATWLAYAKTIESKHKLHHFSKEKTSETWQGVVRERESVCIYLKLKVYNPRLYR